MLFTQQPQDFAGQQQQNVRAAIGGRTAAATDLQRRICAGPEFTV
jgi:hypothetical protein